MNQFITSLDEQFALLHQRSRELIASVPPELLYRQPEAKALSCGELVLRSAAVVEQTFGGITTNLWDDPAEWTLPETLATPEKVLEYLEEVEATRRRGFVLFKADEDLLKEIMAPSGETLLVSLLLDTLTRAALNLGRASATSALLTAGLIKQSC